MTIRQSTQEEADARLEAVLAAECKGDGIHSTDMRFWHDWRLWQREPKYRHPAPEEFPSLRGSLIGFREVWYCTRCRKIEEREVEL